MKDNDLKSKQKYSSCYSIDLGKNERGTEIPSGRFSDVRGSKQYTPRAVSATRIAFHRKSASKMGVRSALKPRVAHSSVIHFDPTAFVNEEDDDNQEVEIDLEDILVEEASIFGILESIKNKTKYLQHISDWWEISSKNFSKQVKLFEGDNVKKLVREYQIIFILTIGYLEFSKSTKTMNMKTFTSLKNILTNVHNNYMVFVEFLYRNISDEQIGKTRDVCLKIQMILNDRPSAKQHCKQSKSRVLKSNNDIALTMLKSVLRNDSEQNYFVKGALEIIKNISVLSVDWIINYYKNKYSNECLFIYNGKEQIDDCKAIKCNTKHIGVIPNKEYKSSKYVNSNLKPVTKVLLSDLQKKDNNQAKGVYKHFTPQKIYSSKNKGLLSNSNAVKNRFHPTVNQRKMRQAEQYANEVKSLTINLCTDSQRDNSIKKTKSVVADTTGKYSYQRHTTNSTKRLRNIANVDVKKPRPAAQSAHKRIVKSRIGIKKYAESIGSLEDDHELNKEEMPQMAAPVPISMSTKEVVYNSLKKDLIQYDKDEKDDQPK